MDLNSMLNKDSGAGGASRQPPPPPASLAKTPSTPMSAAPQTPIQQGHPSHAFRDYSHPMHASPGPAPAASPREYAGHPGHPPPAPYASPTTYNAPPPNGYPGRPAPPPIHPPGPMNDPRSPGSASVSNPSPYRQTPTSSLSAASGGYPFPPQTQGGPPPSPQQRLQQQQQYSPAQMGGYQHDPRDPRGSYASQGGAAPVGMPTPQHGSVSYSVSGQQVMPQTPPVGTPGGGNHMYLQQQHQQQQQQQQQQQLQQQQQQQQQQQHHQRSQSLQSASASTPTSAHGPHQPPYGTPSAYGPAGGSMGSPVAASHGPPHFDQQGHFQQQQSHPHQRQTSQPATPLAAPLSGTPRQSISTINHSNSNFAQPPSPYQQRTPSGAPLSAYPLHPQQQQQSPYHHASPPPPQPSTIQRAVSNSSHTAPYDTISESHRRSQSQTSRSERERSISISPKTRVPSLPSSAGEPRPSSKGGAFPGAPPEFSRPPSQPPLPPQQQQKLNHNLSQVPASAAVMEGIQYQQQPREATPGKRKLDDRDLRPDELDAAVNRRPPPPGVNGNHGTAPSRTSTSTSTSPLLPRRKPTRCALDNLPSWALSCRDQPLNASRNYTLRAKAHVTSSAPAAAGLVNGNGHRSESNVKSEHVSRHTSPEATRSVGGGTSVKMEDHNPPALPLAPEEGFTFRGQPFPLECISLVNKPIDFLVKAVGDFLYMHVLANPGLAEIQARGVQFEIEAKFGTIIDRDTDDRLDFPLLGECVLSSEARVGFRSSMSELQHRTMNDWLNKQVVATTDPRFRNQHVPIQYKHRREIDKFYELHSSMVARLPHAVQALMSPKHPLKARITVDQKTGDVLAKIVKARVGDLNIYLPDWPVDCRISVNLEWDWDGPPEEITSNQMPHREKLPDREKDRLSYKHGFFQVDLTQVKRQLAGRGPEKEHELEVELDAGVLLDHGRLLLDRDQENKYQDIVEMLVNNVRALARKCPPASGIPQ